MPALQAAAAAVRGGLTSFRQTPQAGGKLLQLVAAQQAAPKSVLVRGGSTAQTAKAWCLGGLAALQCSCMLYQTVYVTHACAYHVQCSWKHHHPCCRCCRMLHPQVRNLSRLAVKVDAFITSWNFPANAIDFGHGPAAEYACVVRPTPPWQAAVLPTRPDEGAVRLLLTLPASAAAALKRSAVLQQLVPHASLMV